MKSASQKTPETEKIFSVGSMNDMPKVVNDMNGSSMAENRAKRFFYQSDNKRFKFFLSR